MAACSASTSRTGRSPVFAFGRPRPSVPKAPKATFPSDRFIALHMSWVRISPAAPTSDPAMISIMLPSTNPVAAAASPE